MSATEGERSQSVPPPQGFRVALEFMLEKKIDFFLWMTRIGTAVFTVLALIPVIGNPYSSYQRALMCSAATSALRLHQRMPRVQLTREFGALLLMEDSCHYLLYSILFIMSYPVTLSLLPVFLFAILHSIIYTVALISKLGFENCSLVGMLNSVALGHQRNILKLVAFTEVCLMPITIVCLFSGKGSLLSPFAYYRFLTFRYASRRNPYTRNVFREMRLLLETFANSPRCNQMLRNMCYKVISMATYLAPPVPVQQ